MSPRPQIHTGILLSWARAWTWMANLESCLDLGDGERRVMFGLGSV